MRAFFSTAVRFGSLATALMFVLACFSQAGETGPQPTAQNLSAADLVKKALASEVAGQNGRRDALLCEAIRQSPECAAAHWQLGEILYAKYAVKDAWLTPSQVELATQNDRHLAAYRQQREAAGQTVAEQVALAQWCRKYGLDSEGRAHWVSVLQLQPNHPEAIRQLGLRNIRGALLTAEQVAQYQKQSKSLAKALERWRPLMTAWRKALDRGETSPPAEVRDGAVKISEPAEMLAFERVVWQEIHGSTSKSQNVARAVAEMLSENPHSVAADCLAQLAVMSESEDVRDTCIVGLKKHSFDHYVPLLLAGLQTLTVFDNQPKLNANRFFANFERVGLDFPELANGDDPLNKIQGREPADEVLDPLTVMTGGDLPFDPRAMAAMQRRGALRTLQHQTTIREAAICSSAAEANRAVAKRNARILDILHQATGLYVGEEPLAWWKWWWEEYNDTYTINTEAEGVPGQEAALLYVVRYVVAPYVSNDSSKPEYRSEIVKRYAIEVPPPPSAHSCFAPGTKVWTQLGKLPIEKLKPGDCVLAQNAETGELAYKPILQATVRRPGPRIKVGFGSETITATPSHPFWVNGRNWQLTKQLEVGQILHTVAGGTPIDSLEEVETDPSLNGRSYNLIIADFNSYFVGEQGILVHDNTPREPTSMLIPGLPAETTAAEGRDP